MSERRYILMELSDAQRLAQAVPVLRRQPVLKTFQRIMGETGGDFEEIANMLKALPICHACVVEGQHQYCNSLDANKLGRRLQRLIKRAQ